MQPRRLLITPLLLLYCLALAPAQISPGEQAYERYRAWFTQFPPNQQAAVTPEQYRAHLQSQGLSASAIDEQIRLIREQGPRAEAQRWNRILTSQKPSFNTNPNAFLVDMAKGRKPGTALDVGMGQGRNALWLAQQGWQVTGFDPAAAAVALAQKNAAALGVALKTEVTTREAFDFGDSRWDLILISYAGGREVPAQIERALRPGGILIIEGFHRDATRGRSIGGSVVFDTGEIPKLFPDLRVVRYEEPVSKADFGQEMVRLVRYCAQRPE
ncbi:MAG: class I SAM-dependent methyltransferase [Acidobacteria bacterium]|nr:class I SAM-dependent methyltransferase [Acidobacteriota bacterium]